VDASPENYRSFLCYVASKFSYISYILKYNREFSNGTYKKKNNNLMSEYGRMSFLSVIT
jgi:hypothetical protein